MLKQGGVHLEDQHPKILQNQRKRHLQAFQSTWNPYHERHQNGMIKLSQSDYIDSAEVQYGQLQPHCHADQQGLKPTKQ